MTFPLYSTRLPFAKPFCFFSSATSLIPFCLPLLNSPEALLNSFNRVLQSVGNNNLGSQIL